MIKHRNIIFLLLLLVSFCIPDNGQAIERGKKPVEYVNPYMGNISHLLVPTFPTIYMPNSMVRVQPYREDYTGNRVDGLPLFLAGHRTYQAFSLHPLIGDINMLTDTLTGSYLYDHEKITPYQYSVYLDDIQTEVKFALSHQSAMYEFGFHAEDTPSLVIKTKNGEMEVNGNTISGFQYLADTPTRVFLYMETEQVPVKTGNYTTGVGSKNLTSGKGVFLTFDKKVKTVKVRYGISYIDVEQAKKNLYRELADYKYNLEAVAQKGKNVWNETLGKITVTGGSEEEKTVFYTSLYRTYERMVSISEEGRYYSGYDNKIHKDEGIPFYVDDWLWDTYRATHPLRVIIEPEKEIHMVNSLIRIAEQTENFWLPTFPGVAGDSRGMNCNHGVAVLIDCYRKGLRGFDLQKGYEAAKKSITERTLAPWSGKKAGILDEFYKQNGYFPALSPGEKESVPEVHSWEKRQAVAVTLGTVYDEWCLAQLAKELGKEEEYKYFIERSLNYRKVFNPQTGFFHPKDKHGIFVEPFDYRYSGGLGARDAYDENNGWIYRWDVQHNFADLVELLGGKNSFVAELERMYNTPLGKSKWEFYATLPDHTGNVGQFSMGNEPCLHIPYLYNYAGEPWRTQKRVRELLKQWFRNDLMGMPGDEDGGGLTAFVVFSMMGFYPVTPGLPMYVIGSPVFEEVKVKLADGKTFRVICNNYSPENKYIQAARLNGKVWEKSWFTHDDLMQGGTLELTMGKYPNKTWATSKDALPPSFKMPDE